MNAEQAVEAMKRGERVTFAQADTGIFFQMCHQDKILMLNTNGCQNGITAYVDKQFEIQEFLNEILFGEMKSYEQ